MADLQPRDESPLRYSEPASSAPWGRWLVVLVLLGIAGGAGYFLWRQLEKPALTLPPDQAARTAPKAEARAEPEPEIKYPVETPQDAPLPTLQESDSLMREMVSGLIGSRAFGSLVQPQELARRFVATVDNLPRRTVPTRIMAHKPVPGSFSPGAPNEARYAPYVRALESLDARAVVERYRKAYPLFQQAYADLGFPNRYFNDRLVEAIDDMLAAPELAGPPELVQPKVFYQYSDPALENRSAGQKIMMRLGAANAAKVRAKLGEIRAELVRQSPRQGQ